MDRYRTNSGPQYWLDIAEEMEKLARSQSLELDCKSFAADCEVRERASQFGRRAYAVTASHRGHFMSCPEKHHNSPEGTHFLDGRGSITYFTSGMDSWVRFSSDRKVREQEAFGRAFSAFALCACPQARLLATHALSGLGVPWFHFNQEWIMELLEQIGSAEPDEVVLAEVMMATGEFGMARSQFVDRAKSNIEQYYDMLGPAYKEQYLQALGFWPKPVV